MKVIAFLLVTLSMFARAQTMNWVGTWNMNLSSLEAIKGTDNSVCCVPSSFTVVHGADGVTNQVIGSFDLTTQGCKAAGVSASFNVTAQSDPKNIDNLIFDVGNNQPLTLTLTPSDDQQSFILAETIASNDCAGFGTKVTNVTKVAAVINWEGAYKVTPAANQPQSCCNPISNLEINTVATGLTIQGEFDTTYACTQANVYGVVFTSQITDVANPTFTIDIGDGNLIDASLNNANGQITYTNQINGRICSSTLTRQGDAVAIQATQWTGTWQIAKTTTGASASSCCFPNSSITLAPNSNAGYTIMGTFENSKGCASVSGSGKSFTVNIYKVDTYSSSIATSLPTIPNKGVPFSLYYHGKTATAYFGACTGLLTNQDYQAVPGFPSASINVPTSTPKSGGHSYSLPPYGYAIIIMGFVLLILGVYLLYNKRKTNQSGDTSYLSISTTRA